MVQDRESDGWLVRDVCWDSTIVNEICQIMSRKRTFKYRQTLSQLKLKPIQLPSLNLILSTVM